MGKSLEGKVAIVTGSGQGIGKGIARYLAMEGAKVITNNRKPGSGQLREKKKEDMPEEDWNLMVSLVGDAESAACQIREEGGEATPYFGDISDWDTARKMVEFAVKTYGKIDIIINNAGGTGSGAIDVLDESSYDKLTCKMKGSWNMMHFAVPYMKKQGFGRIINISSEAWTGLPDNTAYSIGNAGVVGLTWAAAKELWNHGITVNCICPQGESPAHSVDYRAMVRNVENITGRKPDPEVLRTVEANHGDPIGIGPVAAFLSGEESSYISGNIFAVYASGVVRLYSEPDFISRITKDENEELFTQEELKVKFKELLGPDYVAPASGGAW